MVDHRSDLCSFTTQTNEVLPPQPLMVNENRKSSEHRDHNMEALTGVNMSNNHTKTNQRIAESSNVDTTIREGNNYGPWMLVKSKYKRTQNLSNGKNMVGKSSNYNTNSFHVLSEAGTSRELEKLKKKMRKETQPMKGL